MTAINAPSIGDLQY